MILENNDGTRVPDRLSIRPKIRWQTPLSAESQTESGQRSRHKSCFQDFFQ